MNTHTLLIASSALALLTVIPAQAQGYLGTFYPKSPSVSIQSSPRSGFGSNTYHNSAGAGTSITSGYCYPILNHGSSDIVGLTLVANYNVRAALLPSSTQLQNFMADKKYAFMMELNNGFGNSRRSYASAFISKFGHELSAGTWALGIRGSKWSGYASGSFNPLTGHEMEMKYIHAYQPGTNPNRYGGSYHSQAWVRDNIFSYSMSQPPLPMGNGTTRRWKVGTFGPRTDSEGNVSYRYYLTGNSQLGAETGSGVYFIAQSDEAKFLNGGSVTSYLQFNGWTRQELRLPPGRTYSVVVQDTRKNHGSGKYSSVGAQVRFHIARYY